ncbi:hypothetical protein MTR_1g089460 [Medicago truncatula]|uniref:Uncharacterized protein n=1 Tax=Medicago truncatula TaxID=3880 RepID=G7I2U8_MEDTR|nr:hypothetical protein MTR_1g089460 [Medicago truncatula]
MLTSIREQLSFDKDMKLLSFIDFLGNPYLPLFCAWSLCITPQIYSIKGQRLLLGLSKA